ncbi:MAG: TonB-dependent receptor domain-containing protein [Acidobacteriaceae bacterium]
MLVSYPFHFHSPGKLNTLTLVCIGLVMIFACSTQGWSQAVGSITGTVADLTGAVIPQAKVTATRSDTGVSQTILTTGAGLFTFTHLDVGTYSVTAEAKGFNSKSVSGITVDVTQERNVSFTLSVAGSAQTAEVTAAPPLLDTTNALLSSLVTTQQVVNLPLNGKSIANLVMMQPGVAPNMGGIGLLSPTWSGNGNRAETAEAQLDGADVSDAEMGTIQFWNFNMDTIAEFKVLQANYSAEFGEGGGTITQIVSKSGTNQYHGSAYEFIRNSRFDALNYFSTTVPPLHRNEFGVDLGGPILKKKLFFEGEYAGLRQSLGEPTIIIVPTAAQRTGLVTIGAYQYQVPLNSVAKEVLNKYPLPNQPNGIYGANTYNYQFSQPTTMNQYSVRIDYTPSQKDALFARYSQINNTQADTDPVAAIEGPGFSASGYNWPRNLAFSEVHTFTPNLQATTLLAFNRQIESSMPSEFNVTDTSTSDNTLSTWGPDSFISKYVENYYDPSERIAWNIGRHSIVAGVLVRYGQDDGIGTSGGGPNGEYTFSPGTPLPEAIPSTDGGPTIPAGAPSPSGIVSMMEGEDSVFYRSSAMPGYGTPGGFTRWGLRVWDLAAYIQDNIRWNDKLTVDLGLRYEYQSVPYEIRDRLAAIVDQGPLLGHMVLNPEPLYQPDRLNFAPRLGIAYQASSKSVIRGGFAIFTNIIPTVYPDQAAVLFPLAASGFVTNAPYSLASSNVELPSIFSTSGEIMPPNGKTTLIPPNTPINLANIAAVTGNIIGDWASEELRNGYTMSGNLTFEQELTSKMAFTVSGVSTDSTTTFNNRFPNAYYGAQPANTPYTTITPGLGEVMLFHNQGILHYLSLQTQIRNIAPEHGMQFQVNYAWTSDLTNSDSIFSQGAKEGAMTMNDPTCLSCEYGPSANEVRQRLSGNFIYALPGDWAAVPKKISRGWELLGIFTAQTGEPFTVGSPYGTYQYGIDEENAWAGGTARPNFIKKAPRDPHHRAQYFTNAAIGGVNEGLNTGYWGVPTTQDPVDNLGTVQTVPGNMRRNSYYMPSWWNLDTSMIKNTSITTTMMLQLRAEFFNVFNHPTFGEPVNEITASGFGLSSGTATSERQMQFGARFVF